MKRALKRRGSEGWLVGGATRDLFLDRADPDLDAVISADPFDVAAELSRAGFGTAVALSQESPRVCRVAGRRELDLAELEGGEIHEDLARRDFTVNAVAIPLGEKRWIDPYGGLADLRRRRLRMISEANLRADPLRALRAARFIASHGLMPDSPTSSACRRSAALLASAAPERVRVELEKLLSSSRVAPALLWAAKTDLLGPALCRPLSTRDARALVERTAFDAPSVRRLSPAGRLEVRLALLASALRFEPEDAARWLATRRFSRSAARRVALLVRLAGEARRVADRDGRWAWVRDAGGDAPEALLLARLLIPRSSAPVAAAARAVRMAHRPPRVTGKDILAWLRIPAGPAVGQILRRLEIEGVRGRVRSRTQAKTWLLERYGPASGADS